ncbi:MAG: hypothetical protein IJY75_05865 [Bacteroidaceae bacterium]|nr:hypothetical protein [Bacteroidaceae bacterium]
MLMLTTGVSAQVATDSLQERSNIPEKISIEQTAADTLYIDSIQQAAARPQSTLSGDSSRVSKKRSATEVSDRIANFKPQPYKATWLAVVLPGAGQIYNRKYWKLPIVYGGIMGCLYAYNWNNQMYSDYRQAFLDIMDADPNSRSYESFFPSGYDFEQNEEYLKNLFKKRKDRYRRWRDLSIFACVGVYLISIIDAYVDAHLSSFDISEDINLSIQPDLMRSNASSNNYYGLNCNISF